MPNNPVPNVDMKLAHLPSLEIISSTKTNSSGFYTFSNMPFGAYYIFADIPGLNFGTPYIRVTDTAHLSYTQLDYYINCSTITPTSPLSVATINNTEEFISKLKKGGRKIPLLKIISINITEIAPITDEKTFEIKQSKTDIKGITR